MTDIPDPIDKHVGLAIRAARYERDMSQDALAAAIGLTFQQVQKYERAANRVSCSKLVQIAKALDVSPADLLPQTARGKPAHSASLALAGETGGLELARTFLAMSPDARRALLQVAAVILGQTSPIRSAA